MCVMVSFRSLRLIDDTDSTFMSCFITGKLILQDVALWVGGEGRGGE